MKLTTIILLIYIIIINLLSLLAMGIDKWKAKKNHWRIPEKRLFLYAILGGATGGTLGMSLFHHKTNHWYFKIFFPILMVLDIVLYTWLFIKLG